MNIDIPQYLTEKEGLVYVRTHDENNLHQSFLLEDGQVLVFESLPNNYPSNALCVFETIENYLEAIQEIEWINDQTYIVRHQLEAYGFPFSNEHE